MISVLVLLVTSKVSLAVNLHQCTSNEVKVQWFHPERTGASFANTLFTWACSSAIDDDFYATTNLLPSATKKQLKRGCSSRLVMCPKMLQAHYALDEHVCETRTGGKTFVGMFREPTQRLMSFYFHQQSECNSGNRCNPYFDQTQSPLEMAIQFQGCYTKMLNGELCGTGVDDENHVASLAGEALSILKNEFLFIGLTEDWDMSVCLFHTMFGGYCHKREFLNIDRLEEENKTVTYDTKAYFGDWTDKSDHLVYETARSLFYRSAIEHRISKQMCRDVTCADVAVRFAFDPTAPLR